MRIAIVGAGITGLTLAYLLEQRGHSVEVFEAGRAPGGELATVDVGGEPVERFYHHLFTHDRSSSSCARSWASRTGCSGTSR